ncbi:MAG: CCA tRNA nucleotidyltransferase, partial [Candidatus Dormibacteraceae bacterium]
MDPAFPALRAAANQVGVGAWAVGGYVRDRLLGRPHPDLDMVVEEGEALTLARTFARLVKARPPIEFPRFGTARVVWGKRVVEFASARRESYTPNSRNPEVVPASLTEDLLRRDFTINTLLMDLAGGVHDLLGARADIERRLLRTPSDPIQTFSDDPLRMLRGVRFAAELGFELERGLLPTMSKLAPRLGPPVVAVERIREELIRILVSPRPSSGIELLWQGGLLERIWPEVAAGRGVEQGGWHTHDVYGHT